MTSDLLLLGHGSRDAAGAAEFLALVAEVAGRVPGRRVAGGVLEFAGPVAPGILEAAGRLAAAGADRVVAQPVLLFHGGHDRDDMPRLFAELRRRYPSMRFALGRPFGGRREILELAARRADEALAGEGEAAAPVGVLLVARGTTHPEANADMWRVVRLFWERHHARYPLVEGAFVSLAPPFVPEGLTRLRRLGARTAVVVPYFLNTGILVARIRAEAQATAAALPGMRVAVARHFGLDAALVDVLLDEARRAEAEPREVAEVG